ncbi:hypothetical protein [Agromyces archimandritae]|uniref:Uncharacterized protein n=1 Tax=Agromyces archimandritae TaxID=2781962 RepID=A0A975FJE2_9MICO|nr:hypothetical protein [Agromyces archimandritae]QTX03600.1 hypothetical protein G127AT_09610 [Agromyces archimandritae]
MPATPAMADTITVSTFAELQNAFTDAASDDTVAVDSEFTETVEVLELPASKTLTLDVGASFTVPTIQLGAGSNLTITSASASTLTVQGGTPALARIRTTGATLNVDGDVVLSVTASTDAAAIGGDPGSPGGTVTLGGTAAVTARNSSGTAIGGGSGADGGDHPHHR